MLSKEKRLNLKKDFKWAASGKKLDTKFLKVFVKVGDNELPRVGIALSSDVFKKAHQRSRLRRVISSAFEVLYNRLPENANFLALPKPGILGVKSAMVLMDLEDVLKTGKLLKDEKTTDNNN